MRGEWPLVGRDRDLAVIAGARAGTATGGLLLAGPAGVGKTRLAREAVAHAEADGQVVRWVRATRAASRIPLAAFAPLLPADLGDAAGGDQLRRAAGTFRDLAGAGERGDVPLLVVDDVQFLDETSATLLLQLVATGAVFVIATMRTGEETPESVTALWKDDLVDRYDVRPLSADDVVTLLQLVLGDVEASSARTLARASGGNPLYLRELVLAADGTGSLRPVAGLWRLVGQLPTSPRLHELVSARLAGLSDAARNVLDIVAVGEPVGVIGLERHVGLAGVDDLERRGLIEIQADERRRVVRMAHSVYGEVVRESMTARAYRDACRGLADAVEEVGARRRDDRRRVAMWRLEAGAGADPTQLLDAAYDARVARDYEQTERLARAAWESGGDAAAGYLLGEVLDEVGRNDEAEAVLAAAAAVATTARHQSLIAVARSDNLFRGLGRADEAERVALEAASLLADDALRGEVEAQRAINRLFAGRVDEVLEIAGPMLESSDLRAYSQAALPAAMAQFLAGRYDDAVETATRAFEARIALGDQVQLADAGVHLVALAFAQIERGEVAHGIATARAGYDGAAEARHRNGQAYFAIALARGHLVRGELDTSMRYAREAAILYDEFSHPGARWGYGAVALARAQAGDAATAEEALADLDAEPATAVVMVDVDIDRARAWTAAARGELPQARTIVVAAVERAHAAGQLGLELAAAFDLARLGDTRTAATHLDAIADRLQGDLARARVAFVGAAARGDGGALDAVSSELEAMEALLWAAEASNEAAIAFRAAGDSRRAQQCANRARELAARCEGPSTPSLRQGTDTAVLTKREREIATLAAQGASSREIAAALSVSHRTIENHLQRAYEKLGVSGRAELAAAMQRAGM